MDPIIWSQLPMELLEHVLARLPPHDFLLLRPTCKHFSSLIRSPSFLSLHSNAFSPSPCSSSSSATYLLLCHPHLHSHHLYDFFHSHWRSLPFPVPSPPSILSASAGLILFTVHNSLLLFVCNPLTKSFRCLRLSDSLVSSASIVAVTPSHYMIMAASLSQFHLYDSIYRRWRAIRCLDPSFLKSTNQQAVFCNGVFYFACSDPFSVAGFRVESAKWEVLVAEIPDSLAFLRLASCNERLFMVGGLAENGICRTLSVWEIVEGRSEMVELQRVPDVMCRKFLGFCYHNYQHIHCIGHGDFVCVYCSIWPEVLAYMVSRRTWHWFPRCPSLPDKWIAGFRWFSFSPSLYSFA